jgi:O-antigen ligase
LGLGAFVDRTDSHRRVDRAMLAIAGAAVGAVAALLAASKMAVLTIGVASVLLLAVAVVSTRGRRRRLLLSGAALVAVLLGAIAVSGPLRARIADATATHAGEYSKDTREIAWRAGLRMAGDYPLTGSGFGALAELIPAYLPRGESELWVQLHNDYLEVLVDGGAIAAVLIAWMAAAYAWRLIRALRVDAGRGRVLPTLGLTLGLAALAAHEAVDFNLQVPANALMFVVIAAIAVAPLAREGEAA